MCGEVQSASGVAQLCDFSEGAGTLLLLFGAEQTLNPCTYPNYNQQKCAEIAQKAKDFVQFCYDMVTDVLPRPGRIADDLLDDINNFIRRFARDIERSVPFPLNLPDDPPDDEQPDKLYRAMSNNEWRDVQANRGLSIRNSGSSELCVSPDERYILNAVMGDFERRNRYQVAVEFTMEEGTVARLISIGALHTSALALEQFSGIDEYRKGMDKPMIKFERGIVNFCLGNSPSAVDVFNSSIISFRRLN